MFGKLRQPGQRLAAVAPARRHVPEREHSRAADHLEIAGCGNAAAAVTVSQAGED
ncbi:MAG: hypothetical protein M3Y78_03500 [Pseudomonadota bacterium]|nr:hypothetical protein [Pseudomonadota bacterium]